MIQILTDGDLGYVQLLRQIADQGAALDVDAAVERLLAGRLPDPHGLLVFNYTTPAVPARSGTDVVAYANAAANPTASGSDSYTF